MQNKGVKVTQGKLNEKLLKQEAIKVKNQLTTQNKQSLKHIAKQILQKKNIKIISSKSKSIKNLNQIKKAKVQIFPQSHNSINNLKNFIGINSQGYSNDFSKYPILSKSQSKQSLRQILRSTDAKTKKSNKRCILVRNTEKTFNYSKFQSPQESNIMKNNQNISKQLIKKLELQKIKRKKKTNKVTQSHISKQNKSVKNFFKIFNNKNKIIESAPPEQIYTYDTKQSTNDKSILELECEQQINDSEQKNKCEILKTENDSKNYSLIKLAIKNSCLGLFNLFQKQKEINEKMRVILINWIIKISSEIELSRETVHLALTLLDSIIKLKEIQKKNFQLIGLSCLLIAYKQQISNSQKFIQLLLQSCDNGYTKQQILICQKQIMLSLKFKLNPSTYCFWIDYFTKRWDRFIEKNLINKLVRMNDSINLLEINLLFRESSKQSYNLYRQLNQIIDTLIHFEKTLNFEKSKIVVAALYLIIRVEYEYKLNLYSKQQRYIFLFEEFKKKASPIFKDRFGINQMFNQYLVELCEFELGDIIQQIKYISNFLDMKFEYNINQVLHRAADQVNYEQFIRLQIHSESTLQYVLSKI